MVEMDVKQRLKIYLDSIGTSQLAFCKKIGVSTGYISSMRKSISPEKISSIAANYPTLNITWLLTGHGTMLNGENLPSSPVTAENSIVNSGSNNTIEKSDDSFWKGIVQQLMEKIDHLSARCSDYEQQNRLLQELLEEAKKERI